MFRMTVKRKVGQMIAVSQMPYRRASPGYSRRDRAIWRPGGTLTVLLKLDSPIFGEHMLFPFTANRGYMPLTGNLRLFE